VTTFTLIPNLFQVLLDHGGHALSRAVPGVGHDGEFHGITTLVLERLARPSGSRLAGVCAGHQQYRKDGA